MDKSVDRELPANEYVEKEFMNRLNRVYQTPEGGKVDMNSAVSLLNRYCQTLPSDQFTLPSVIWEKKKEEGPKVIVGVTLPIQANLREEIEVS